MLRATVFAMQYWLCQDDDGHHVLFVWRAGPPFKSSPCYWYVHIVGTVGRLDDNVFNVSMAQMALSPTAIHTPRALFPSVLRVCCVQICATAQKHQGTINGDASNGPKRFAMPWHVEMRYTKRNAMSRNACMYL